MNQLCLTFQQAREIAQAEIGNAYGNAVIIIDEQTIEKDYAWIFCYTSGKFWETKNMNDAVGGNAPLFVSKLDGKVSHYRTGLSIEEMIDAYEEENKIWSLSLEYDIFNDTGKTLAFRKVSGMTIQDLANFKNDQEKIFEWGSERRLTAIQTDLAIKGINSSLIQRKLGD